jgi:hypothetical protein
MKAGLVVLAAGLAACSEPAADLSFETTLSTQQLMKHVVDPAAVAVWKRQGWDVVDGDEISLAPDTEEEWAAAENEAAIVAEAGNLLVLPGRVQVLEGRDGKPSENDRGDWTKYAHDMSKQALALKAAIAARDEERMFATGGDLYQACVACHEKYYVPFLKDDETTRAPTRDKTR